MVADGKYELAASLLESSGGRFARSGSVAKTERLIYRKLMEQYQNYDPFKFIPYSAKAGERTPHMTPAKSETATDCPDVGHPIDDSIADSNRIIDVTIK